MAVTGKQVFDLCMGLIDEVTDSGTISESDTKSYKVKTPMILSILQTRLAQRERLITMPGIITDITLPLAISDETAIGIMPYGLAAHLLLDENPDLSGFFNDMYSELQRTFPNAFEPIEDVYGSGGEWQ